ALGVRIEGMKARTAELFKEKRRQTAQFFDRQRMKFARSPEVKPQAGQTAPRKGVSLLKRPAPDFVVTPKGQAIPIQTGARPGTATSAPGIQYGGGSGGKGMHK